LAYTGYPCEYRFKDHKIPVQPWVGQLGLTERTYL